MTLILWCGYTLIRAMVIALAAALLAQPLARYLSSAVRPGRRFIVWALLLTPLLTPALLVGYAYVNFAQNLVRHPAPHAGLYALLVLLKFTPIAALVVYFAPAPALNAAALHVDHLLRDRTMIGRGMLWLRGPGRARAAAFAVVFLLAFTEFELVSLMEIRIGMRQSIRSWTLWLYDAQVAGTPLSQTLRYVLMPAAIQLTVIGAAMALLVRATGSSSDGAPAGCNASTRTGKLPLALAYLVFAAIVGCMAPLGIVLHWVLVRDGAITFERVIQVGREFRLSLLNETRASLFFGISAAIAGMLLAPWLLRRRRSVTLAACLPGFTGSLTLGLVMLALFQLPVLRPFYDTPTPLLLALVLLLLPLAVIITVLLRRLRSGSADHLTDLLAASPVARQRSAGRRLKWETRHAAACWTLGLLFYFAYFDLSASALLAPSHLIPVTVRLYNQMHFGRSAGLSALLCAAMATPGIMLALAVLLAYLPSCVSRRRRL